MKTYDVIVVGGGPAGATAAMDLAQKGRQVAMLDRAGRIKPCGGAIPPRLIRDFDIPDSQIVARAQSARMISPSEQKVDMPIDGGYVGMVDREFFDEYLRERAEQAGVDRITGTFVSMDRDDTGRVILAYQPGPGRNKDAVEHMAGRAVIGADGARSKVAQQSVDGADRVPCVFAYHEIIESPPVDKADFDGSRCDVYYQGKLSPDFYAWVFPHGATTSVGVGSANKGFSLRGAVAELREQTGLSGTETIRCEGAPIPLKPLKRWDNGRDTVLAGDAAGIVAPASGEGIYYAMVGGRCASDAVDAFLTTGKAKALAGARSAFMKEHGRVFWILGMMQKFWYCSDKRRERFVSICRDPDVQRLTWEAYMNKKLVRRDPMAHMRIFFKDLAHLFGMVAPHGKRELTKGH